MPRFSYIWLSFIASLYVVLSQASVSLEIKKENHENLSSKSIEERRTDSIRRLVPTSDKKHDTAGLHPSAEKTDVELFHELAKSLPSPVADKVSMHHYAEMYGNYLVPYLRRHHHLLNKGIKFLEIGLGCGMGYKEGAIASVQLWQAVLTDQDELWEAEYDAQCVTDLREKGLLNGIKTVTGDQGNTEVLQRWIKETGGQFDVVIDDGGHHNDQIYDSFINLWPQVKPGGLYFIEDLQVGRTFDFRDRSSRGIIMADIMYSWIEQLLINTKDQSELVIKGFKIPRDIRFISCQREACVIGKCDGKFGTACS